MSNSQRASIHYMKNARIIYGRWSKSNFSDTQIEARFWYLLILAAASKTGDYTIN